MPKLYLHITMYIKDYIKNNPYRVLGVATTDSSATLMSHNSRMKAFASIGKTVSFPLDYDEVFGEKPSRNLDDLASALSALSNPESRLRHGMFWFMNSTPTDALALAALERWGDPLVARRIWEDGEQNMSSLQNQLVCCLLKDPRSYSRAIQLASTLYGRYGREFVLSVANGFEVIAPEMLFPTFLAEIVKASGDNCIWWDKAVIRSNNPDIDNLWAEAKARPLLVKLQDALNVAQSTELKSPRDHADIAYRLMIQAEPLLKTLKALASTHPKLLSRYNTIADTVAEEVLNRGITYWNRGSWVDDIRGAVLPLDRFCYRYACSAYFKNRCKRNLNIALRRPEDAVLFPNGMPDNHSASDRKKCNAGISAILEAIKKGNLAPAP